jgi:PHP family Zn ribbon phosphoesterase
MAVNIDFLELGLSADTSYGAAITDLAEVPFLSNSDAHSPLPEKIGREFNCIRVKIQAEKSVRGLKGLLICLMVFRWRKYNCTARPLFHPVFLEQAVQNSYVAQMGSYQKGAFDRAVACRGAATPPTFISFLGQIIRRLKGLHHHTRKGAENLRVIISTFGNEIDVLGQ